MMGDRYQRPTEHQPASLLVLFGRRVGKVGVAHLEDNNTWVTRDTAKSNTNA